MLNEGVHTAGAPDRVRVPYLDSIVPRAIDQEAIRERREGSDPVGVPVTIGVCSGDEGLDAEGRVRVPYLDCLIE